MRTHTPAAFIDFIMDQPDSRLIDHGTSWAKCAVGDYVRSTGFSIEILLHGKIDDVFGPKVFYNVFADEDYGRFHATGIPHTYYDDRHYTLYDILNYGAILGEHIAPTYGALQSLIRDHFPGLLNYAIDRKEVA